MSTIEVLKEPETSQEMRGLLAPGSREGYILAGNATVTVLNPKTGNRFTYRIRKSDDTVKEPVYWVRVLSGPDNTSQYQYLGTIFKGGKDFRTTKKSGIKPGAPSFTAFEWISKSWEDPRVEVWHEGSCGRCGRKLTVPESIASGIGPTCAGRSVEAAIGTKPEDRAVVATTVNSALRNRTITTRPQQMKLVPKGMDKTMWTKTGNGFATEISTIRGSNDYRCPQCKERVAIMDSETHKHEGEITHWTLTHQCGMHLTIFND